MSCFLLALALSTTHDPAQLVPVAVPAPTDLAMDYYRSGVRVWFLAHAWGLLVPVLLLVTGLSGRLRDLSRRIVGVRAGVEPRGPRWSAAIGVYAILYFALNFAIDLPIRYALGYVRPHAYGLSNQSLGRWMGEGLTTLAVSTVVAGALLWVPYTILARRPRTWWLWTGLLSLPFAIGTAFVKPIWIDPLFNHFEPMAESPLKAEILALAERAGIEGSRVFVVDKSRDTRAVNAYVTGLFGTKRIVIWDTMLRRLDGAEVAAVVGHEMGHYVLNHVAWGVTLTTLGSLGLLFLVDRAGRFLIARFGRRFRMAALSDVASMPLLIALVQVFSLIGAPAQLAVSRWMEHEADRFGLEVTRTNHASALSFVKIQMDNLANPRPGRLSILWRSSHPPIAERIEFCNAYHPWTEGRPGRYVDRFTVAGSPSR